MRKIRIAQIGVNKLSHHREIYETLKNNSDIFDFVGYAFPENEKEATVSHYEKMGFEEISRKTIGEWTTGLLKPVSKNTENV